MYGGSLADKLLKVKTVCWVLLEALEQPVQDLEAGDVSEGRGQGNHIEFLFFNNHHIYDILWQ